MANLFPYAASVIQPLADVDKRVEELPLIHGGDIRAASDKYGIPLADWLDLSTGINPFVYPKLDLSEACFKHMPYLSESFERAIGSYYFGANSGFDAYAAHSPDCMDMTIPCAGSQAIIEVLPAVMSDDSETKLPVLLPSLGYQEHQYEWEKSGYRVEHYDASGVLADPTNEFSDVDKLLESYQERGQACHLVVINPNNPTGQFYKPEQLAKWADQLVCPGKLVIDEAFIDAYDEDGSNLQPTVLWRHFRQNMVVLRSFGKFFGLPGLRLGFGFAESSLASKIKAKLGLWTINGPAQEIASRALVDQEWQRDNRQQLRQSAESEATLFEHLAQQQVESLSADTLNKSIHTPLFSSYLMPLKQASELVEVFAQQGILLRVFDYGNNMALVRIGRAGKQLDRLHSLVK